jgi:hypothetical protein
MLLKITKFLNLRIEAQVNCQISQWLKFRICTKIIKKKRNKFQPSSMRRFPETKKRLDRWLRCWRLWMTKVFYRNACSTTSISKLPMTMRIKKDCKRTFAPNSGVKDRLVSKGHILRRRNSTNRSKSSTIGTRSIINSLRNKVPRKIC